MLYVPNPGAATDPQCMCSISCLAKLYLTISGYNTTGNTVAMAEIFTAVIVATIMTMRPCFQIFATGIVSTFSSTSRTRLGSSTKVKSRNSHVLTSVTASKRQRSDRQGFNKIAVTTEVQLNIELQSRDRSTEELFVPVYHRDTKDEKTIS